MKTLVFTVIGDDRPGLIDVLSGVVVDHGGNWDDSHMAQLAGKFVGVAKVTVPDNATDALIRDLEGLGAQGLLSVTVERAGPEEPDGQYLLSLELVGLDHPGIIQYISHALATRNVSIEEMTTQTKSAPMSGGILFEAKLLLQVPVQLPSHEIVKCLEDLASDLMVDIEVTEGPPSVG